MTLIDVLIVIVAVLCAGVYLLIVSKQFDTLTSEEQEEIIKMLNDQRYE